MWSYVHIYFKTLENWRSSKDWEEKQKRSEKGEDWEDGSLDEIMPCSHENRCSDLHEFVLCSHEDRCWDFLALCSELVLAVSVLGGSDRKVPGACWLVIPTSWWFCVNQGDAPVSTSGLHRHMHRQTHSHTCTHCTRDRNCLEHCERWNHNN